MTVPPVTPGEKWYSSATYLGWMFSQAVSLVVLVMSLIGHPINGVEWQSVASAASLFVAGITTTIFIHARTQVTLQKMAQAHDLQMAGLTSAIHN